MNVAGPLSDLYHVMGVDDIFRLRGSLLLALFSSLSTTMDPNPNAVSLKIDQPFRMSLLLSF